MHPGELAAAWAALRAHDRRAEVPDVIGHADALLAFQGGRPWARRPPRTFPLPRPAGGTRRLTLLDPGDEAGYRAAVEAVVPAVEAGLGPKVAANRAVRPGVGLEPWRRARRRLLRLAVRQVRGRPDRVAVLADVRDCYARIQVQAVEEALLAMGCHPAEVGRVGRVLESLRREGVEGLPVGPEPSAVLANAVLAGADRAGAGEGCRVLRWVDDFLVSAPDAAAADRALRALEDALARAGLALATEKTRLTDGAGALRALRERAASAAATVETSPPAGEWGAGLERAVRSGHDLAAVRALRRAGAPSGGAEAALVRSVAADGPGRPDVRAWAWRALARHDPAACLEAASALDAEPDPAVRRAVVAAAALGGGPAARPLLRSLLRRGDVGATAAWGLSRRDGGERAAPRL